jgi:hypothetical protein
MTTTISRRPNAPGPSIDPPSEPYVIRRVQVHQHNDSRLLEFFNTHGVEYDLTGDHLFIIRSRKMDMAAGPGDWLVVGPDGEVDVERGDYALRAQRAITRARNARRERSNVVEQQRKYRDLRERTERERRRHEQFLERIAQLQTERPALVS